jgi:hypothetical protein
MYKLDLNVTKLACEHRKKMLVSGSAGIKQPSERVSR